jgi:hypothetical protein
MTESEWLTCTDPVPMFDFIKGRATARKLRMFGMACWRKAWDLLDEPSRAYVVMAERYADGEASREQLAQARRKASGANLISAITVAWRTAEGTSGWASMVPLPELARSGLWGEATSAERIFSDFLHDLFGPLPFRPVSLDPSVLRWNDGVVVRLAQALYDDRRFWDLPVLGDCLEEAGCTDPEVLEHCRSGGDHVRGCWAVDLVLGRG